MACGYEMARHAFERDLAGHRELCDEPLETHWPFDDVHAEITSTAASTPKRAELLRKLQDGSKISM